MTMTVFDRRLKRRQRDRAAAGFADHDFLAAHAAAALVDRLLDIKRDFGRALDLGCHTGALGRALESAPGKVGTLIQADLSPAMAARAAATGWPALAADEEALPFAEASFDLVASALSLHWVNDLPGALVQVQQVLRPDGLFLAALLGGDTLIELRQTLFAVEAELLGGVSPRLSPVATLVDMAALLQRAGFALPVADAERVTVTYDDAFKLITDLRGMAETGAVLERDRRIPPRAFWPTVAARYAERWAEPDGRIPASFEILYVAGWRPAPGQQQPLRPGQSTRRLADALGVIELPAGDKARP